MGTFNAPSHFPDLLEPRPADVGVEVEPAAGIELDLAVIFVIDKGELRVWFLVSPSASVRMAGCG